MDPYNQAQIKDGRPITIKYKGPNICESLVCPHS